MKVAAGKTSARIARYCGFAIVISSLVGACNDPYSRNRIAMRQENLRDFEGDVRASEARRAVRLREAGETLNRWWIRDSERFNRKMPTVGDYFW